MLRTESLTYGQKEFHRVILDLHLFDGEGGAGAAASAGDGAASGSEQSAVPAEKPLINPKRSKRNPLADVKYGRQPQAESAAHDDDAQKMSDEVTDEEWTNARKGRYKARFDAEVQSTVQNRIKNIKASEENLGKLAPILEGLAKKYGK